MLHSLDWLVLILALGFVLLYGFWQNTKGMADSRSFLAGNKELRWWTIGLSIMATQASAVTFLSTPGQGYDDGVRFVQFYFGMPIAMFILAIFILPIYYKLNVITAYEYLENRFDLRMRSLTASLFLIQRSLGAAITLNAPSIVLSVMFGWDIFMTNAIMAVFVVVYTTLGGHKAVSRSQEMQMTIMLSGLIFAFFYILYSLPEHIKFSDAWQIASIYGKTKVINWDFSFTNRYTFWSGVLGATFLFLSYFGTDQSQVGRYLSGKSLKESRIGLLFNGIIKVPMQFLVLSVGVMVFVFYQFNAPPFVFSPSDKAIIETAGLQRDLVKLEEEATVLFVEKKGVYAEPGTILSKENVLKHIQTKQDVLNERTQALLTQADPAAKSTSKDYIFLTFIMDYLPKGLIGLMLAMVFSAAWSTTASELNALTTTSVVDIYKRSLVKDRSEAHYLRASRWLTVLWGGFILWFATNIALFDNLIQAVNMIGSIFYGTLLGIFFSGFFIKKIGAQAVFWAAICTQTIIAYLFFFYSKDPYLWYNPLGCFLVMGLGLVFETTIFRKNVA